MASDRTIQIFRKEQAGELMDAMTVGQMTPEQWAGVRKMAEAGYSEGEEVRVLVNIPGFSLTHAWLKKDYPLLLHTHDSDCLYYVLAGSLQMGVEELGAGDSLFVPGGAAYQYRPGPDGVEVLEFRHATAFDFQNVTRNPAFYEKGTATITANVEGWRTATRPSARFTE